MPSKPAVNAVVGNHRRLQKAGAGRVLSWGGVCQPPHPPPAIQGLWTRFHVTPGIFHLQLEVKTQGPLAALPTPGGKGSRTLTADAPGKGAERGGWGRGGGWGRKTPAAAPRGRDKGSGNRETPEVVARGQQMEVPVWGSPHSEGGLPAFGVVSLGCGALATGP